VAADPAASAYCDQALTPASADETDEFEIFNATDSAKAATEKARQRDAHHLPHIANSLPSASLGRPPPS
jgi:hypothetical protein